MYRAAADFFENLKISAGNFSRPMLPRFLLTFLLAPDASIEGLGAVPTQREVGKCPHAVLYASCVLWKAEKKYSETDNKVLAVVWYLKHRDIIYDYPIESLAVHQLLHLFKDKNQPGKQAR